MESCALDSVEEPSFGRGRPKGIHGVTPSAVKELQSREILPETLTANQVTGETLIPQAKHQIMLNWFRIHLLDMTNRLPSLSFGVLPFNSPFALDATTGTPLVRDEVPSSRKDQSSCDVIVPDMVFHLQDSESGKTLLFFLEVDLGSEPRSSAKANRSNIEGKLANYQAYFRSRRYERYEKFWKGRFNGFRVLLHCAAEERLRSLCNLVQTHPPSDFIWLSTEERLFREGLSGCIWVRGGKIGSAPQSIIGRLSQKMPLLPQVE